MIDTFSRADIQSANALSTIPKLPSIEVLLGETSLADDTLDPSGDYSHSSFASVWAQESRRGPSYSDILDKRIVNQIAKLQRLSSRLDSNQTDSGGDSAHLWLGDALYSVLRELMLLADEFKNTPGLGQACCIAGIIYVECFLRNENPKTKILEMLNARLQRSMLKFKEAFGIGADERESRLLLWSLFVGAVSSKHFDWYIQALASLPRSTEILGWNSVDSNLKDIAFPSALIPTARRIWEQVVENWQGSDQPYGRT
jgi:hypothetical protein